jgi:hypothetical protein
MGLVNKTNEEKLTELKERVHDNDQYLTGPDKRTYTLMKEDRSVPHVTNLNEDEQLAGKLFYPFKDGSIHIGRKQGDPKP